MQFVFSSSFVPYFNIFVIETTISFSDIELDVK